MWAKGLAQIMDWKEIRKMKWTDYRKLCLHNGANADPKKVFTHNLYRSVCLHFFGNGHCTTKKNCPNIVSKQ